jgi:hypothetical protein
LLYLLSVISRMSLLSSRVYALRPMSSMIKSLVFCSAAMNLPYWLLILASWISSKSSGILKYLTE